MTAKRFYGYNGGKPEKTLEIKYKNLRFYLLITIQPKQSNYSDLKLHFPGEVFVTFLGQ